MRRNFVEEGIIGSLFVLVFSLAGVGLVSGAAAKKPLVLTMFSSDINPNYNNFEDPVANATITMTYEYDAAVNY